MRQPPYSKVAFIERSPSPLIGGGGDLAYGGGGHGDDRGRARSRTCRSP
ncbi:hypothetical protein [Streptomyces sp. NPDC056652]